LTNEVLDSLGWLKTGDIARIIDGFVHIVGRSKEILVTSTGEKVSPVAMEMVLEQHPLIDQAMVVGEGRPFLTALVVVNPQAWRRMASTLGLQPDDPAALHTEAAAGFVLRTLTGRLRDFPASAQVRGVFLLDASWTIDNGLLTPTMKLKREQIFTRYAGHIEEMYRKSCAL
jgi:long-chain acyl-CoA synthetase